MLSSLAFLIEEAWKSIRRNGLMSITALSTVAISLSVFGGASYSLYRLHQFVNAQPERFHIAVFFRSEVPRPDVLDARSRIAQLPGVAGTKLVTREEALAQMRREDEKRGTRIVAALEGANPLPDRVDVRLVAASRTRSVAAILRDTRRFPEIETVRDERDTVDRLLATSTLVRQIGLALAILMLIATSMVVQNTLRLTVLARHQAIAIMRLVGATPAFIRFPLILEGLFHGVVGSIIAGGIVLFVAAQSSRFIGRFQTPLAETVPPAPSPALVMGIMLLVGAGLGLVTSALAIRRFLK
jgi:cell division transport system permease protein